MRKVGFKVEKNCILPPLASNEGGVAVSNLRVVLLQGVNFLGLKYFQSILQVSYPIFLTKMSFSAKNRDFRAFDAPISGLNAALETRDLRTGRTFHASTHVPSFKSIEAHLP